MKHSLFAVMVAAAGAAAAGLVPEATFVGAEQGQDNVVRISYTLANAPAIVTLDVQTNGEDNAWTSIGALNVFGPKCSFVRGANTLVEGNGRHEIEWRPHKSWAIGGATVGRVRFALKAYAPGNAPDYMAVRLDASVGLSPRVLYFPDAESLPGGVLGNEEFRKSILLMKRVHAKNMNFDFGDAYTANLPDDETVPSGYRAVTFPHDYYMGVFELTQKQWEFVHGTTIKSYFKVQGEMRPMESCTYQQIREAAGNSADPEHMYPKPPHPDSFLGKLRTLSGIDDFDLPSEVEWEYAARAGLPDGYWNDGSVWYGATETYSTFPGRCYSKQAAPGTATAASGPENGTAICGSYTPSRWGFYDFHGNVSEMCLDWTADDVYALPGNTVNADGANRVDAPVAGEKRVARGGGWNSHDVWEYLRLRTHRTLCMIAPGSTSIATGFRVKCRAGLK